MQQRSRRTTDRAPTEHRLDVPEVLTTLSDLRETEPTRRWPLFAPAARLAGLRGADAVPLRRGHRVIGGLSVLREHPTPLEDGTLSTVQALADLAAAAVLHGGTERRPGERPATPVAQALRDRVIVEQATGMVAERHDVSIEQALARLRSLAERDRRPLVELATEIVERTPWPTAADTRPAHRRDGTNDR